MELVLPGMLGREHGRGAPEVSGELGQKHHVAADCGRGIVAELHVVDQPLSQGSHGGHARQEGNRNRARTVSILTTTADRAQDLIIVTIGTSRSQAEAGKAHRRSAHAPALAAATGCPQDSQRGPTSVASKGRELSRSGLVRLPNNATTDNLQIDWIIDPREHAVVGRLSSTPSYHSVFRAVAPKMEKAS